MIFCWMHQVNPFLLSSARTFLKKTLSTQLVENYPMKPFLKPHFVKKNFKFAF
jgi:hypothetical protein